MLVPTLRTVYEYVTLRAPDSLGIHLLGPGWNFQSLLTDDQLTNKDRHQIARAVEVGAEISAAWQQ